MNASSDLLSFKNYIDGQAAVPASGQYLPVYEPARGVQYAQHADSTVLDVDAAVAAADRARRGWASMPAEQRADWLRRIADGIEARLEEFAAAESRDSGKPLALARSVDIPRAVSNFRFFAAQAELFSSECHEGNGRGLNYTLRQPLGAVACISPWNLPLYLLTWKIAPALAAGNTVVAKPSEITPCTAWMLGQLCAQIGLPAGVLNLLQGRGAEAGSKLVTHPRIKAVSFTGSTATGSAIASSTATQFKKLSLEMGGKNAAIVFADCDIELAVEELVRGAFNNQGQICLCMSRILVERSIWTQFRDAYVARVKRLKVGNPTDPQSNLGAIVSEQHMEKVLSYIALAHEEGGRLLCGGERVELPAPFDRGWFIAPTVFDQLPYNCRVNQEEVFGPFTALMPFDDEQQALSFANGTVYGLATSLWTSDLNRAHRMAAELESGIVWINCWMLRDLRTPFGGVKHSGVGREGGLDAMRFFTEQKNVCIKIMGFSARA